MSTNVTVDSLRKVHGDKAPDVFNEISRLCGAGVSATGFGATDGGIAVNADSPNYDKIKVLLTAAKAEEKKEGK